MVLMIGSLQLGILYGLLALGVFISFKVLNIPDLTAEGSFTFGLAVSAAITISGHPFLAIIIAMLAGALAGVFTGLFQTKFGIHPVLAGILTMSGLYSINLLVMGSSSNLNLIGVNTIFRLATEAMPEINKEIIKAGISLIFCVVLFGILAVFLKTQVGLCIRATGDNEDMVTASSINVDVIKIIALAISNACIALSGALIAQFQGYADINSGIGIVVVGLASVIIGEVVFGKKGVSVRLVSAIAGSIIYRFIIAFAIMSSFLPEFMLKFISAFIVAIALSLPTIKSKIQLYNIKREAAKNV